ncbi:hypothetical protein Mgra_00010264, partial [Meloidogyne graminicola]
MFVLMFVVVVVLMNKLFW